MQAEVHPHNVCCFWQIAYMVVLPTQVVDTEAVSSLVLHIHPDMSLGSISVI